MKLNNFVFGLLSLILFITSCDEDAVNPDSNSNSSVNKDTITVNQPDDSDNSGQNGNKHDNNTTENDITFVVGNNFLNSCEDGVIIGEGDLISQEWNVTSFGGIDIDAPCDITISQGDNQKVTITGHPNILSKLSSKVENQIFELVTEKGCYQNFKVSLDIVLPTLNYVALRGAGKTHINTFTNQNEVVIKLTGSNTLELTQFEGTEVLDLELTGSGDIRTVGKPSSLTNLNINSLGSGTIDIYDFEVQNCSIKSLGSGDCYVYATNSLSVDILGSGSVSYKGTPNITKNILGSGRLIDTN